MKSVNEICSTSSQGSKLLFDALCNSNHIDSSWRTTLVDFYDIEDPGTPLPFKYSRVNLKDDVEKKMKQFQFVLLTI